MKKEREYPPLKHWRWPSPKEALVMKYSTLWTTWDDTLLLIWFFLSSKQSISGYSTNQTFNLLYLLFTTSIGTFQLLNYNILPTITTFLLLQQGKYNFNSLNTYPLTFLDRNLIQAMFKLVKLMTD